MTGSEESGQIFQGAGLMMSEHQRGGAKESQDLTLCLWVTTCMYEGICLKFPAEPKTITSVRSLLLRLKRCVCSTAKAFKKLEDITVTVSRKAFGGSFLKPKLVKNHYFQR